MGTDNNKDSERESYKLRLEILSEAVERYQMMAHVFFRRLEHEEKIDALIEVATQIREEGIDG